MANATPGWRFRRTPPPPSPGLLRRRHQAPTPAPTTKVSVANFADLSYYATLGGYTIDVTADIDLLSTVSISGVSSTMMSSNSAVLSGQGSRRLFYISSSGTQVRCLPPIDSPLAPFLHMPAASLPD